MFHKGFILIYATRGGIFFSRLWVISQNPAKKREREKVNIPDLNPKS